MERKHAQRLRGEHPDALRFKKPIVLRIPDDYNYGDPKLIEILQQTIFPVLNDCSRKKKP